MHVTARKSLRIAAIALGVLLLLLVAAVVAIPLFVDPNDYRDDIERAVLEQTGRELNIEGDIELSVFPWLGLHLGAIQLTNAAGFGDEPMARLEAAELRVRLLPLLRRRVEVGTLGLDGLRLNLARDTQGRTNWDDILEQLADEDAPAPDPGPGDEPPADGAAALDPGNVVIHSVRVRDARVRWHDGTTGTDQEVRDFNLETGRIAVGEDFPLELSFRAQSSAPALDARFRLRSSLMADPAARRFEVGNLRVDVNVEGEDIPGGRQELTMRMNAHADLAAGTAGLEGLRVETAGTRLTGEARVDDISGEVPSVSAQLHIDTLDIDRYLPAASESGTEPATPAAAAAGENAELPFALLQLADFDVQLDVDRMVAAGVTVSELTARAVNRGGQLHINPMGAVLYDGTWSGEVRVDARAGRRPAMALEQSLEGVQSGGLVHDLLGEQYISGLANMNLSVAAVGNTGDRIRRSLTGDLAFSFDDGRLHEFDLARRVSDAYESYRGREPDADRPAAATEFAELHGSARIEQGVLRNRDLSLRSPVLTGAGEGMVDLVRERIDYVLTVEFMDETGRGIDRYLEQLRGVPIPVRIRGPLADASVSVPVGDVLEARAREELRRQEQKVRERADEEVEKRREELEDKARDRLRELLR